MIENIETAIQSSTMNGYFIRKMRQFFDWLTSPAVTYRIGEPFFRLLVRRGNGCSLELRELNKVLVVRLDEIGDVVMTTPLLRELRRNLPNAWISIVVKPQLFNLLETCPYVNEVLTFNWCVQGRLADFRLHWRALYLARKKLWPKHYDLAILPRWDTDYYHGSNVAYFSGALWRIGYPETVNPSKESFAKGYDKLFSHVLKSTDPIHEVEKNLEVIKYLGGQVNENKMELWFTKEDEDIARVILDKGSNSPDLNKVVAFCPGASRAKNIWPLSKFVELGFMLNQYHNIRIVVIGGPGEEDYGECLVRNLGDKVFNLIGKLTLRQTAAVLKKCSLYVGNDTGPMHLAAAVGTPVVAISQHPRDGLPQHQNSPERFGPWDVPSVVVQPKKAVPPCVDSCSAMESHCICTVEVDQVKEAVFQLLGEKSPVPSLCE